MKKISNFNKYLCLFIFSSLSLLVFVINYTPLEPIYLINSNEIVNFFDELLYSIKPFDIIYVMLLMFIFYFYSNVYFNGKKYDKKSLLCTIIAIIFVIITILSNSFSVDDTLNSIYSSKAQIIKTILFSLGYYFIYYSIIKELLNVKFNLNIFKKKI